MTQGKALLSKKLSRLITKDVEVGALYIMPPFSISVNNFKIEGLLSVDKIKVEPSITGLFLSKFGLNNLTIVKPKVSIIRLEDSTFNFSDLIDTIQSIQSKNRQKSKLAFFIKEAALKDVTLSFEDKIRESGFDIEAGEISAITSLWNLKTRINLDAQALSRQGDNIGKIKANGWLNFLKKDMDATLSLEDVDAAYFSNFFSSPFLSRVQSGTLLFSAKMVSKNNDLTIDCHLDTGDLTFFKESSLLDIGDKSEVLAGIFSGTILDTLTGAGAASGVFNFSIHTKFDRPRLEGLRFKASIFKSPMDILTTIPKEGADRVKKMGEDFKAIGKEFEKQIEAIKEQWESPIKKEEPDTSGMPEAETDSESLRKNEDAPQNAEAVQEDLKKIGKDLEKQFKDIFKDF